MLGQRIREAREARGWSQPDLARAVGTSQQQISRIEHGQFSRLLNAVLTTLDIDGNARKTRILVERDAPIGRQPEERDLPIFASVEAGSGYFIVSSDPVDYAHRPDRLDRVKDAYGILVIGDSMIPAYEPGDMVLIHPHLPPINDCDVVLYSDDNRVMLKRLIRSTADEWILLRHNPPRGQPREFSVSKKTWNKCHCVVGKYNRR